MKVETLRDLWIAKLQDLYSAEKQITVALPKLIKAATNEELVAGFEEHLKQTAEHIKRLESIFDELKETPGGHVCVGMKGILKEGAEAIEKIKDTETLDAALISGAQSVEHYEIAGYGTAVTYANLLNKKEAALLLDQTLQEEKETDVKLTELSQGINVEAM